MKSFKHLVKLHVALLLIAGCGQDDEIDPNRVNVPSGQAHERLSQYNFFKGAVADLDPNPRVIPYDLNTPLFSDYASKKRFVYVPEGSQIPYDPTGTLDLPVGSVLIKHFYYGANDYIETRLLIRKTNGWEPETYIWEDDLSDATRSILGGSRTITVNVGGQDQVFNYTIPNQNDCKNCHSFNGKINPIGPKAGNLNKSFTYETGVANQLQTWIDEGILAEHSIAEAPQWPEFGDQSATLESRARAYLDSNCSSCHRSEGSAFNSGLFLDYDNQDDFSYGFFKRPVAAGNGSGGLEYVILPGNAEASILWFRMNSTELEVRMPEIGRALIHQEGVELIKEWIDSLE